MKGLFCCDWTIYVDEEGNYYDITLTNEVLDRYLKVVDILVIAIRVKPLVDKSMVKKYSKIPLDRIQIVALPNILSLKGILTEQKNAKVSLQEIVANTDLIFVRLPSAFGNMVTQMAKRMGKPYLAEIGGCAWDSYWNHSIAGKIMAPYMFMKTRNSIRNANFASYVTKSFLQRRYPNTNQICSCSNVVIKTVEDNVLLKRVERIANMDTNKPIIIGTTAAVNVKYKGQQYIIEAISQLNKKGWNFEYQLVGNGDNSYLKNLAKKYGVLDKVHFLGVKTRSDVMNWLDNIDIYAQPSRQEGLPRALVEAMSRACPSIGSRTAGIPELLNENMLFRNGDIKDICNRIGFLVNGNMKKQAELNFELAKEYNYATIEEIRQSFFYEYLNTVK